MSGLALEKSRPFLELDHEWMAFGSWMKSYQKKDEIMPIQQVTPRKQSAMLINIEERKFLPGFARLKVRPL